MASSQLQPRVVSIRQRLWRLLLQAFGLVVLLTAILLLITFAAILFVASRNTDVFRPPFVNSLETYYAARGSWDGIERLLALPESRGPFNGSEFHWEDSTLLDANGLVLLDHGQRATPLIGQPYPEGSGDLRFRLTVGGRLIGTLIIDGTTQTLSALTVSTGFLAWTALFSLFPAILTGIIALLLARRVVRPLADVMGAAQAVASGDLSARVGSTGPDELHELMVSFNHMAGALERNDRERRDMLADVAHELRTPLTVIRGRLEGIIEGVYASDEAHITPVLEEVYLLERLVEDLRLLTLAETRQLPLHVLPVSLAEAAGRIARLMESEALAKDIDIRVETDPAIPLALADSQRVDQVIANLLSNALRYVPAQGVVKVRVSSVPNGISLAVVDNGPGVTESELPHIFDRFWRLEKSRSRSTAGAGLGLAIARQLIEAQGGSIIAANRPDGGLIVTVVLPRAELTTNA